MTLVADDAAVARALYGKMAGDVTLNGLLATPPSGWGKSIYYQEAPESADYPFVIFQKQAGVPRFSFKSQTFQDDLWLVKGVDRQPDGDADPVDAIAKRIKVLLTDGSISIAGATAAYFRPDADVNYGEPSGDHRVFHAGATFRLIYQ